jgi:hypothetical protein
MEDSKRNSFYDLLANSKVNGQEEENKKLPKKYIVLSWIIIFFANSVVLWQGWNYAISPILNLPSLSFTKSILIYAVSKVLTRGLFSAQ